MASIPLRTCFPCFHLALAPLGAALVREAPERSSIDALLRCAQDGDTRAFERVRDRFEQPLLRFVTHFMRGDATTAEDVVQETFVVAWHKLDQIKSGAHLRPWLYQVARYKAISFLRRRGPRGLPLDSLELSLARGHEPVGTSGDPLRRAMTEEPRNPWVRALHRAIARLPEHHVAIMRLHYMHALTTRDIARLLQVNRTTVKMRMLRGRKLLRRLIAQEMQRDAP